MILAYRRQNKFTTLAVRVFNDIYDTLNEKFPTFQTEPLSVIAGNLSIDENRERGGSPRSKHLVGEAIDVRTSPDTDDRKCVLATVAEYVFVKKDVGSEIAVDWGVGGHVHIAVIPYKGVHKRFSIKGGEVWASGSKTNIMAVKKAIQKYSTGKIVITDDTVLDIDALSGALYHRQLDDVRDSVIEIGVLGDTSRYRYEFALHDLDNLERRLGNLNTSPVINWEIHKAIDYARVW